MKQKQDPNKKTIFAILSSEIRVKIIQKLAEKPLSFTELSRILKISTSNLSFHLKKMEAFVESKNGKYDLTEIGKTSSALLNRFEVASETENQIKIASIGMVIDPHDINSNIKGALRVVDTMSSQGADLVCLPFINIIQSKPIENTLTCFAKKARDLQMYISFGFFELKHDKNFYSTILAMPDGDFTIYRGTHKYLFPSFRTDVESTITTVNTKIGKIGLISKDEYIYPELFRILKLEGSDYVVCPTFRIQEKFQKIIQSILLTRTIENQLIVALSSSSFFPKEAFGYIYSPTQDISSAENVGTVSKISVSTEDIKKNRDYFKQFFPRRPELYRELVKTADADMDILTQRAPFVFPITNIRREYEIENEDFVEFEEIVTFEKPLPVNIPMTGYLRGSLPVKEAKNLKLFDDFGPLEGVITKNEPYIEFVTADRFALMPGKTYSTGFRCITSDPIKTRGTKIVLTISFDDFNKYYEASGNKLDEYTVEVLVGKKFKFIRSTPTHSYITKSKEGDILTWRWIQPDKLAPLKIKLGRNNNTRREQLSKYHSN